MCKLVNFILKIKIQINLKWIFKLIRTQLNLHLVVKVLIQMTISVFRII